MDAGMSGITIGRYHILEQIGEGGMATVYKAFDTRLERDVAVKVIHPVRQHTAKFLKRFEREAKALAQLSHPNIVKILDYGEYEGQPYLVMEYIPGGTLKQKMGIPMAWEQAAELLIPIADALSYAHMQKIVHRDVKPANILITASGQPMLSDFGIAKVLQLEETIDLTGTGVGVGTPEYMSPEQGLGEATDHRADIYSLGVVFYELVTGRKPFRADTPMAVVVKQIHDPLPHPKTFVKGIPTSVERVLFSALVKDPSHRFQEMESFMQALKSLARGGKVSAPRSGMKRKGLIIGGLSVTIVIIVVFGILWGQGIFTSSKQADMSEVSSAKPSTTSIASSTNTQESPSATQQPTETPTFTLEPSATVIAPTAHPIEGGHRWIGKDISGDVDSPIGDIVRAEATYDRINISVVIQLEDIPDNLVIDKGGDDSGHLEFVWAVILDTDNNVDTGGDEWDASTGKIYSGWEKGAWVANALWGDDESTIDVNTYRSWDIHNLMIDEDEMWEYGDEIDYQFNSQDDTLTLIIPLPEIDSNFRIAVKTDVENSHGELVFLEYVGTDDNSVEQETESTVVTQIPVEADSIWGLQDVIGNAESPLADVVKARAILHGETLDIVIELAEVPESLPINQLHIPENGLEYYWGVNIDVDIDGTPDHCIMVSNFDDPNESPENVNLSDDISSWAWVDISNWAGSGGCYLDKGGAEAWFDIDANELYLQASHSDFHSGMQIELVTQIDIGNLNYAIETIHFSWDLNEGANESLPTITPSPTHTKTLTHTPQIPSSTPTATATSATNSPGTILFEDDFSDPQSGWSQYDTEEYLMHYNEGAYQIHLKTNEIFILARPGLNFTDVVIDVHTSKLDGPNDDTQGVICRHQDKDNFYLLEISSDGYFEIMKMKNNTWYTLFDWTEAPLGVINQGNVTNKFRVSCIGNTLTLYINDEMLAQVEDSDFASGDVGFGVSTYEFSGTDILFDDFIVTGP